MKVKEIIDQLNRYHDPDDTLIMAYWGREEIDADELPPEGPYIPKKDWPAFVDHVNRKMDWSSDAEVIEWMWQDYKKERKENK